MIATVAMTSSNANLIAISSMRLAALHQIHTREPTKGITMGSPLACFQIRFPLPKAGE